MKGRVVISPDGRVNLYVDEGTFEEAKVALGKIISDLKASGMEVAEVGEIEQHRHDHLDQVSLELHNHAH